VTLGVAHLDPGSDERIPHARVTSPEFGGNLADGGAADIQINCSFDLVRRQ
jgi:hypothetical protein